MSSSRRLSNLLSLSLIAHPSSAVLIQKSITIDPESTSANQAAATAELLDAQRQAEQLRDTVARQEREVEALESRLVELTKVAEEEVSCCFFALLVSRS